MILAKISTLEIVLLIILGIATSIYVGYTIYRIIDKNKHPEKYDENGKKKKVAKNEEEY